MPLSINVRILLWLPETCAFGGIVGVLRITNTLSTVEGTGVMLSCRSHVDMNVVRK